MDSLSIFFIVTTIFSLILTIYSIYLTRKQKFVMRISNNEHSRKLSLVFAIGGLLGSIIGYAIKYIPTIWERPFERPNLIPPYETMITIRGFRTTFDRNI